MAVNLLSYLAVTEGTGNVGIDGLSARASASATAANQPHLSGQ